MGKPMAEAELAYALGLLAELIPALRAEAEKFRWTAAVQRMDGDIPRAMGADAEADIRDNAVAIYTNLSAVYRAMLEEARAEATGADPDYPIN